jgi:DNA-binding NtrC family response regulator
MPEEKALLERVVKEKIEPLIEEAMQKYLGITIAELEKDITEKIEQTGKLVGITVRVDLPFKEAKKIFKKEFLERAIQTHYGNVSEVADKVGLDRRSVHRDVKSLKLDMRKLREKLYKPGYFEREAVDSMIRRTLDAYRAFIHPEKLEQLYVHVPELSEHIVQVLPHVMRWKEAEREFELVYLRNVLEENHWGLLTTARAIKLRYETLLRKMKKLGISK